MSNRTMLVENIANRIGSSKVDADSILLDVISAIKDQLNLQGEAVLPGFGCRFPAEYSGKDSYSASFLCSARDPQSVHLYMSTDRLGLTGRKKLHCNSGLHHI